MADITKCLDGDSCPKALDCYRFTATESMCQSWSLFYHHHYIDGDCVMFRDNEGREIDEQTKSI